MMRKAQIGYGWDGGVVVAHIRHVTQPWVSVKLLGRGINPEKGFVVRGKSLEACAK